MATERRDDGDAAPSPQATRVESLFHLVRDGSSAQIRENAAEKLGEIARQSPEYCRSILRQIHAVLVSSEWDVRVAAAKSLDVLARAFAAGEALEGNAALRLARASFAGREASCPRLNALSVDMDAVLREGAPLLRSGGEEYEYQSGRSADERRLQAVRQRQLLLRRICGSASESLWRSAEDALAQQMLPRLNSEHVKELADEIEASETAVDMKEEPATEDRRKRAAEMLPAPQRAAKKPKPSEEGEPETQLDLVALLVADLFESLFDAKWEVRHGSAAALRHVLLSSGLIAGLRRHEKELTVKGFSSLVDQWIEESLTRCLCVLALDQFVDYSADGSVAPVRELTAQAFGTLLGSLQDPQLLEEYLRVLRKLLGAKSWHSSHGGLLGIKYLIQAHIAHASSLAPMVFRDVAELLDVKRSDAEEDILVIACGVLGDVLPHLQDVEASLVQQAVRSLWSIVTAARSSGSFVASAAIQTLRRWYSYDPLKSVLLGHLESEQMWGNLAHIVPLVHHHERAVRNAAVACIEAVASQDNAAQRESKNSNARIGVVRYMLPRLLLQLLCDEDDPTRRSILSSWRAVVQWGASREVLVSSIEKRLLAWVEFLWSLDKIDLLHVHLNEGDHEEDAEAALSPPSKDNLAARVAFADAIGVLISWLPANSTPVQQVVARTKEALQSLSGDQQCGALLLLSRWAIHANSEGDSKLLRLREQFGEALESLAKNDWIPTSIPSGKYCYTEQAVSLQRVRRMQARLTEIFAGAGIDVESAPPTSSHSAAAQSRQIAERVGQYPFTKLSASPQAFEQAHFCRQDLFLVDDVIQQASSTAYARIQGVGSCSYCELLVIPAKKSGFLVKSLMESIKTEADATFRDLTAETLARFVVSQVDVQRKCVTKIVSNLCNSAVALAFRETSETAATPEDSALKSLRVRIDGAKIALQVITRTADASFGNLPLLPNVVRRGWDSEGIPWTDKIIQENSHLVSIVSSSLPQSARKYALQWMDQLIDLVSQDFKVDVTRRAVAQAIADVCKSLVEAEEEPMVLLYTKLFFVKDGLERQGDGSRRVLGSVMVLDRLVAEAGACLTPFVPSLVHFAMKAMHAPDSTVRSMAAKVFADLVPLMSLQMDLQGSSLKDGRLQKVLRENESSRGFLEGLLQGKAIGSVDVRGVLTRTFSLRDYQQHGVNWLSFLVENRMGGVLADDMGLGKTLQVLAAIAVKMLRNEAPPLSLVVCPPIIVHHWIAEASRCFPGVFAHVLEYSGSPANRKSTLSRVRDSLQPVLLVSTYSAVRGDRELLRSVPFGFVVLDEAHLIRNPRSSLFEAVCSLQSVHRFVLSGTPLQNHVGDLWALFSFLMPGYLGDYADFRRDFELPISRSRERNATPKQKEQAALAISSLHQRVLPFVLRRTKDEVLRELPPKIISNVLLPLTPLQKKLYQAATSSDETNGDTSKPLDGVLRNLQLLKKICVHPALVNDDEAVASVFSNEARASSIGWKQSGKMVGLHDLLVESCDLGRRGESDDELVSGSHRYLVFAHLKETLDLIQDMLVQALPAVTYLRLDGKTAPSRRHEIVHKFNDDPSIDLLLLTTSVGGLGLTLTGADTVIFVEHSWNPFVDLQAMDRAHRIGQTRTVRVFRLIMEASLEQHIMDLQAFKEQVASTVVTTTEASSSMNANTKNVLHLLQTSSTAVKVQEAAAAADAAKAKQVNGIEPGVPGVAVELLNQIGELWDQSQYDSLAFPTSE